MNKCKLCGDATTEGVDMCRLCEKIMAPKQPVVFNTGAKVCPTDPNDDTQCDSCQ